MTRGCVEGLLVGGLDWWLGFGFEAQAFVEMGPP